MIGEIRIAGPCAAESRDQMVETAQALRNIGVEIVRGCWWKPRTSPGWEGVGRRAAPWAADITKMGMTVATEVLMPGIVRHLESVGFPLERILLCHRGFHPDGMKNLQGLRNIPDWEMVRRVKEQTGLPMIIDPSHVGGTVDKVIKIATEASETGLFDGLLIEAHPTPTVARTDAKQQLTILQLEQLLRTI